MEYTLPGSAPPDLATIQLSLAASDPSALIDFDAGASSLRISTLATEQELLACLHQAGVIDAATRLIRVPSQCCGGCGG